MLRRLVTLRREALDGAYCYYLSLISNPYFLILSGLTFLVGIVSYADAESSFSASKVPFREDIYETVTVSNSIYSILCDVP